MQDSGVHVVSDFRRVGQFARARERDCFFQLLFGVGDDLLQLRGTYLAALRAPFFESNQRALALPFLDFGFFPISAVPDKTLLPNHVPFPPLRLALAQRW